VTSVNPADLTLSERALLVHAHNMGGWLKAPLVGHDHDVMGDLVRYGLFERIGEGAQHRYALTAAGHAVAEEIANAR
jgi:hypothetical protein